MYLNRICIKFPDLDLAVGQAYTGRLGRGCHRLPARCPHIIKLSSIVPFDHHKDASSYMPYCKLGKRSVRVMTSIGQLPVQVQYGTCCCCHMCVSMKKMCLP